MSGYNIECFLKDFSDRTKDNLEMIENIKNVKISESFAYDIRRGRQKVWEVTQLINSFVGLVIIPIEASKKLNANIKDEELRKLSEDSFISIKALINKCKKEKRIYSSYKKDLKEISVNNFVKHIRNSVSHGGNNGLHFYPIQEEKEITDVIFYDEFYDKEKYEFCVRISVKEIRILLEEISKIYCKYEERDKESAFKKKEYDSEIERLEKLMKQA